MRAITGKYSELGAPCAAIRRDFRTCRYYRLLGRAALPCSLGLAQDLLHDAVLDAVEGNDGDAPARGDDRKRGREALGEGAELIVGRDAQRLKGLRRGVDAAGVVPARRSCKNRVYELPYGEDALVLARGDDRPGDTA